MNINIWFIAVSPKSYYQVNILSATKTLNEPFEIRGLYQYYTYY